MPWNPRFNYVLGGAGAGMAQLGRGATLAQVLAAAAMGSTEAQQNLYDQEQKRAQFEERLRQEIEDRKMRAEEHALRVKEYQDRQTAIANEAKAAETTATENSRQAAEDVKFLLANNITPTAHPDVNKELVKALSAPKKPDFTPEQLYQHGLDQRRFAEQAQEKDQASLDADWEAFKAGSGFGEKYKPPGVAEAGKEKEWLARFDTNLQDLQKTTTETSTMSPEERNARAMKITEEQLKRKSTTLSAPKVPPKDQQPFPAGLTGLPPTGSAVASPTGATAPPTVVPKRNIAPAPAMVNNLSAAIDAAIPDMDPRMKVNAEAQIKLAMLQDPRITPDEAIQQLRQQWEDYRFRMRGGANLMGNPGGQ